MSHFFWTNGHNIAPKRPVFLHFVEVPTDSSAKGGDLLKPDAFLAKVVGSPPNLDKHQFVTIEGNEVDFATTDLIIPSDNGIAQIQEIFGGLLLGNATSGYF
jgi:hypothetical protein